MKEKKTEDEVVVTSFFFLGLKVSIGVIMASFGWQVEQVGSI